MSTMTHFSWLSMLVFSLACGSDPPQPQTPELQSLAVVAGAGYTTFDQTVGGCENAPNGINCNHYLDKNAVYINGGPSNAGLSDGDYFFAVIVPGYQNGGFLEGADGNLSDTVVGATIGDLGTGDTLANRTFHVAAHEVSYAGTHAVGTSPNGRPIIGLAPFDDTMNPGGVYIVAVCRVGATSPSQCKYDAFQVSAGEVTFAVVAGLKYYDANANGRLDDGELGIPNWHIGYTDGISDEIIVGSDGRFSVELTPDAYVFSERQAPAPWMQTGNRIQQTAVSGDAVVVLNNDMTYSLDVGAGSVVDGVIFGNLCLGRGGGHTLGFWSNKNGQNLTTTADLLLLGALHLRSPNGSDFDPISLTALRSWLLAASATNMASMLSAQLAAMELNVHHGFVAGGALVYAPGTSVANVNGFASVAALMTAADGTLAANGLTVAGSPARSTQEALKNALDAANNDRTFVQLNAAACPIPTFP